MANVFCSSCKSNGIQTRVEWRPNPDKPGKNKPFDVDKQEWHVCPYYKPKQEFAKTLEPLEQKPIIANDKLSEKLDIIIQMLSPDGSVGKAISGLYALVSEFKNAKGDRLE